MHDRAAHSSKQEDRIIIIGNSGSGKTTLASSLASGRGLEHLDLDTLAWQATQPPTRAPPDASARALEDFRSRNQRWVAEGCYADLIGLLLPHATELIYLDLPVKVCQRNARNRPWEPHKYPSKEAQDANLGMLLDWIASYPEREGVLGRKEHEALFAAFTGKKRRFVELGADLA